MKKLILVGLLVLPVLTFVGCGKDKLEILPIAEIKIKNYGTIKAELYPNKAPNTVANFVELANNNFYDGLTVHRVIDGFVMQGGCPNGDGTGGTNYSIKGEFSQNRFAYNDIEHKKGVLSMARSSNPDSASSQFFIMTGDAPHLDGQYAAFGKVIDGIEIVDKISKVKTDSRDMPEEKIIIEDVIVDLNGVKLGEIDKIQ